MHIAHLILYMYEYMGKIMKWKGEEEGEVGGWGGGGEGKWEGEVEGGDWRGKERKLFYSTYTLYTIPFCNVELLLYNFDFPNKLWPFCRAEMFETTGNFCC